MPKVSVISGYYNRAHLLGRTVESILKQSYHDFELIVFDDHSPDDTSERLSELHSEFNDSRFKYIVHEQNMGFVRSLRDAIDSCDSEYIAIQGSGDVSLPLRLELQARLLDENPTVGAVGGWYYNVQEQQGTQILRRPDANGLTLSDLLKVNVYTHGEVMIRRETYEQVGGYRTQFKFSQDRDLWLRISKVAQLATVPAPIYRRYVQFDGVSYVPSKRIEQACFSVAAVKLAQMDASQEENALALLQDRGPTAIVPSSDPTVQQNLIKSATRMIIFGAPLNGAALARDAVGSAPIRWAIQILGTFLSYRIANPLRLALARIAGMRRITQN